MGNSGSSQYLSSSQFWAGKLSYFDHESVLPVPVSFNEDDVANLIMAILDEPIIRVSIWKSDLYPGQLSKPVLYHAYLVVRTPRFWWTIEKNDGGCHLLHVATPFSKQNNVKFLAKVLSSNAR